MARVTLLSDWVFDCFYLISRLVGCLLTGTCLRAHFLLDVMNSWLFVDRDLSKSTLSIGCHN